jgi:hypothetical protein
MHQQSIQGTEDLLPNLNVLCIWMMVQGCSLRSSVSAAQSGLHLPQLYARECRSSLLSSTSLSVVAVIKQHACASKVPAVTSFHVTILTFT